MALTCLMSVQVASVFAMEGEPTNKSCWQKTKALFTEWPKTTKFVKEFSTNYPKTNKFATEWPKTTKFAAGWPKTTKFAKKAAMSCWSNKTNIAVIVAATGFLAALILNSKKLAIFTGIFSGIGTGCYLAKLGLNKLGYGNNITDKSKKKPSKEFMSEWRQLKNKIELAITQAEEKLKTTCTIEDSNKKSIELNIDNLKNALTDHKNRLLEEYARLYPLKTMVLTETNTTL